MSIDRRALLTATVAASLLPTRLLPRARAQTAGRSLKFGVLSDMSGPYKDSGGPLSVEAARQAVAEFTAADGGWTVSVLQADHQNKPDIGAGIARQWFDRDGVDVILDCPNSSVALAIAAVAKEKNRVFIDSGAATSDLTGSQCNPNTIHWVYDTYQLAKSTGGALVKNGGNSWYFITADYAFGHALERDTTSFIKAADGRVVGASAYPFPATTDFSSYLLQAQGSGAQVLGLANAGVDTSNAIKQAHEFGLKLRIAALLCFISDVHALGLEAAQGLVLSNTFYWDANDRTRAFSKRLEPRFNGTRPTMVHAGVYSSLLHCLKVAAAGAPVSGDGAAAVRALRAMPADDDCFGPSLIREDGRCLHPSYLWQVKTPAESHGPWDYYKKLDQTPAEQAFRPLSEGGCPWIKT